MINNANILQKQVTTIGRIGLMLLLIRVRTKRPQEIVFEELQMNNMLCASSGFQQSG